MKNYLKERNKEIIESLIANPDLMITKKPFTRGCNCSYERARKVTVGEDTTAELPKVKFYAVSQDQFLKEYDPFCHDILKDENIPMITSKVIDKDGNTQYIDIKERRQALPYQQLIVKTYLQHLCGNTIKFTSNEDNPTERTKEVISNIKKKWKSKNFDGAKYKLAESQLSTGDGAILFYFNEDDELSYRLISYKDGYAICSHNDDNGDRIMECIYYCSEGVQIIDAYDKKKHYRFEKIENDSKDLKWAKMYEEEHGFSEIPVVTKRGDVAWNNGQTIIENIEIQWNILNVIMKRHGFGILYIKGQFNTTKRGVGDIILNSTDESDSSDAKYVQAPTPEGCLDNIKQMLKELQRACSFTIILPEDVKISGNLSGIAIRMMKILDMEKALELCQSYQNVANKMLRLFKEGLGIEMVNKGEDSNALTDYKNADVQAEFDMWMPENAEGIEGILIQSKSAGIISDQTATERSMFSASNELQRKSKEIDTIKQDVSTTIDTKLNNDNDE